MIYFKIFFPRNNSFWLCVLGKAYCGSLANVFEPQRTSESTTQTKNTLQEKRFNF